MKDRNVYLSHGYYFMHSFEICLVGYKNEKDDINDVIQMSSLFPQMKKSI